MAARTPKRSTKTTGGRAPASRRTPAKATSSARAATPKARRRAPGSAPRTSSSTNRRLSGSLLVWVVCGVLVLAAWWIYPVMRMHYVEQRNLSSLQAEYDSVQARNQALRQQVKQLKTPAGIEQAARESLGLVRQGESAYVVIDGETRTPTATASASLTLPSASVPTAKDPITVLLDGIFGFAH